MKIIKIFFLLLVTATAFVFSARAQASDKTKRTIGIKSSVIKVAGNCHMAAAAIEKIATRVEGIKTASYNTETAQLTVHYDVFKKDAVDAVHRKIADAGYDTHLYKASDTAYEQLPACCRYNRKAS